MPRGPSSYTSGATDNGALGHTAGETFINAAVAVIVEAVAGHLLGLVILDRGIIRIVETQDTGALLESVFADPYGE